MSRSPSWSLSEFLNLIDLRSQTWCYVDLAARSGFNIPSSDTLYFYLLLEGSAAIAVAAGETVDLQAGDLVMILSGGAHAVRNDKTCLTETLDFLASGEHRDAPPTFALGEGRPTTQLLAGRLKVRWPGGQRPRSLPLTLQVRAHQDALNLEKLLGRCAGSGAMAILTRAASLAFVTAFRDHPECQAAFLEFSQCDPIARAQQHMQTQPFTPWTVEMLARKVGMGRSTFATRFAKDVGQTPMEFLSGERMKQAAIFLEKTDMKIAEIGARVGYQSEAAFTRRFTACLGMTPGELRKRSRMAAG